MIAALLRPRWERLLQIAERRLPALTRYRQPESLPIALHTRRIYIIPTRFGMMFGVVLVTMLLGALNFNNNAALMLTFLLVGAVQITLPRTVGHLNKLSLTAVRATPVHAGDALSMQLQFVPTDARARSRVRAISGDTERVFDIGTDSGSVELTVPTVRRGWLAVGRITCATEYPLGLFHAWSVLHPDQRLLVYPRPEAQAPPLPRGAERDSGREIRVGGEDWHGLREYRVGDPIHRVAWKASARQDRLLIKEFAEPQSSDVVLDWQGLEGLESEARISRLTRWVLDASALGLPFRLSLPGMVLGPARSDDHTAQCLRELALLP